MTLAVLWLPSTCGAQAPPDASARRGAQLFDGEEPVKGTLVGHDEALPAFASRCINCHHTANAQAASSGIVLTRSALLFAASRRGGPPSRYELSSFCTLLRTGIDPAHIVIVHTMPRYDIDETQCLALWNYVILPGD